MTRAFDTLVIMLYFMHARAVYTYHLLAQESKIVYLVLKNISTQQVSNSSTLEDLMIARARHISCRWPTENDVPLSFTCMSSPPADSTSAFIWHFSRASQIFQSLALPYGSRFSLTCKDKRQTLG